MVALLQQEFVNLKAVRQRRGREEECEACLQQTSQVKKNHSCSSQLVPSLRHPDDQPYHPPSFSSLSNLPHPVRKPSRGQQTPLVSGGDSPRLKRTRNLRQTNSRWSSCRERSLATSSWAWLNRLLRVAPACDAITAKSTCEGRGRERRMMKKRVYSPTQWQLLDR